MKATFHSQTVEPLGKRYVVLRWTVNDYDEPRSKRVEVLQAFSEVLTKYPDAIWRDGGHRYGNPIQETSSGCPKCGGHHQTMANHVPLVYRCIECNSASMAKDWT